MNFDISRSMAVAEEGNEVGSGGGGRASTMVFYCKDCCVGSGHGGAAPMGRIVDGVVGESCFEWQHFPMTGSGGGNGGG